ncbi:MAG: S-methyl-5-thioribose kinase [Anaerolineae bacterium]
MSDYTPLNNQTLISYIRSRPALREVLGDSDQLSAVEVGDGNLNLVFIVKNEQGKGVVLKQALPYLRVAGDSWALTRERVRFETQALRTHNELAPGLAPQVYDYDEAMSVLVMEYLGAHEVMRKPLVERRRFPHFVDHISTFMANTLFFTSDLYKTGLEKKTLQAQFINPHLNKIQEDFVFTNPYMQSPENNWNPELDAEVAAVRANTPFKLAIAEMKDQYMTRGQALIHSDLHTGSIMVNEAETRVIDPEFAFYGPMGFDIGALFANLVLNAMSHYAHTPDASGASGLSGVSARSGARHLERVRPQVRRAVGGEQPGRACPQRLLGLPRRR